jgi:two-component system chemotaxis response regulator CheB
MKKPKFDIMVIGGSAGSIEIIVSILKLLPKTFQPPIVLIIHRMKNITSDLHKILAKKSGVKEIIEPDDKTPVKAGNIYLAPQNYHLLVERDYTFSLDYSEPVNFSRPSIDVSFESIATLYKNKTLAILLSGANKDGTAGLTYVIKQNGTAIVQSPETALYPAMPQSAIDVNESVLIQSPEQIVNYILNNQPN